jgi:hypothetical protein
MSNENEVVSREAKAERRWNLATRILVGLSVCACVLVLPGVARAGNVFTEIVNSVNGIASIESSINQSQSSEYSYNTNTIAPLSQLTSMRSWLTSAENSYKGWFSSVLNIKITSASVSGSSALENALRAGLSGGSSSGISSAYTSVYGSRLTAGGVVGSSIATQADIYDTTAQEGMALAANSDNASMQLISSANNFQAIAGSTAPGTADLVGAEAQALQLQSNAMQHHVLAALLRQEATDLASQNAKTKATSTNHQTVVNKFFGGSN